MSTKPKKYMPLSVAIREGCEKTGEINGAYTSERFGRTESRFDSCAIGAAYWGANRAPTRPSVERMPLNRDLIDFLRGACGPIVDVNVEIPTTSGFFGGLDGGEFVGLTRMPMWSAVEHLFEGARWSRLEIADFVSTYEDPL